MNLAVCINLLWSHVDVIIIIIVKEVLEVCMYSSIYVNT